jgi:GTP-binding protein
MFIDHIRIFAKAGDGGDGVVSWRREKYVPQGGPDGGDGGGGGDVILIVDPSTDNLRQYHYDPKLVAEDGKNGAGGRKTGKSGKRVIGRVPPGTVVYRANAATVQEAVEMERSTEGIDMDPITDLTEIGQEFVLCKARDTRRTRGFLSGIAPHRRCGFGRVPERREIHSVRKTFRRETQGGIVSFHHAATGGRSG